MQDKYAESLADPELLNLREEVALLDSRLEELIGRLDTGEAGGHWRKARDAFEALNAAIKTNDPPAMLVALHLLEQAIKHGLGDYLAWAEVQSVVEQRRRLVESERRRLVDMAQMIPYERAALLLRVISDAVRRNVADPRARAAIAEELRLVWMGQRDGSGQGAEDGAYTRPAPGAMAQANGDPYQVHVVPPKEEEQAEEPGALYGRPLAEDGALPGSPAWSPAGELSEQPKREQSSSPSYPADDWRHLIDDEEPAGAQ